LIDSKESLKVLERNDFDESHYRVSISNLKIQSAWKSKTFECSQMFRRFWISNHFRFSECSSHRVYTNIPKSETLLGPNISGKG
jgi:hypothetical protein